MGAAIVLAWRERQFLRLLGTYLLAVLLHGLWNACAMLYTFSTLAELLDQAGQLGMLQVPLIVMMASLAVTFLVILSLSNRRLTRIASLSVPESTLPPESMDQSP
jgi:hypothetical protein